MKRVKLYGVSDFSKQTKMSICEDFLMSEGFDVVKCVMKRNTMYIAAVNKRSGKIGCLILVTSAHKNINVLEVKVYKETENPKDLCCPDIILDCLDKTENKAVINYRRLCKETNKKEDVLDRMHLKSKIKFIKNRREVTLQKNGRLLYNDAAWYEGDQKWKVKDIPNDFEIVA